MQQARENTLKNKQEGDILEQQTEQIELGVEIQNKLKNGELDIKDFKKVKGKEFEKYKSIYGTKINKIHNIKEETFYKNQDYLIHNTVIVDGITDKKIFLKEYLQLI